MLKALGGCMIFSGCLGLGLWYRFWLIGRTKALRSLEMILELFAGEVRYGRSALPECCFRGAKYLPEPFKEVFLKVGKQMEENTGISFGEIFRGEMKEVLCSLPLEEEDRANFLEFTFQTGFSEDQMQLRAIDRSLELLKGTRQSLERENAEKCRMAVGLGGLGGLLLILILW